MATSVRRVLYKGVRAWRSIAGESSGLERAVRRSLNRVKKEEDSAYIQYTGGNFVYVASKTRPGSVVGIFAKGSCDLASLFMVAPLSRERISGTCCIFQHPGGISAARPDLLLQALRGIPDEQVNNLVAPDRTRVHMPGKSRSLHRKDNSERLWLEPDYFKPSLFEPSFTIPELPAFGPFPKTVVVLSINPALTRTAYRHRIYGYLVDPGGFWLTESMDRVLSNLSTASWFKENFQSIGKMTVEVFYETFGELVSHVKERTGAHVIVYNSLVVDPSNPTHNYQFARHAQTIRRREFDLALRELSGKLDFHILDIDRVLKLEGVQAQVDWAHFPPEQMRPIAEEVYKLLQELDVV